VVPKKGSVLNKKPYGPRAISHISGICVSKTRSHAFVTKDWSFTYPETAHKYEEKKSQDTNGEGIQKRCVRTVRELLGNNSSPTSFEFLS
jgi:hypothetical protein